MDSFTFRKIFLICLFGRLFFLLKIFFVLKFFFSRKKIVFSSQKLLFFKENKFFFYSLYFLLFFCFSKKVTVLHFPLSKIIFRPTYLYVAPFAFALILVIRSFKLGTVFLGSYFFIYFWHPSIFRHPYFPSIQHTHPHIYTAMASRLQTIAT